MAARLGLDPSEFLDKMKGVQGFNGFVSGQMAREWKKSGRDGQEGMRLIDEALGIHVARPVARIVSETFPSLGKAMSAILPGVAFSALGIAIVEFGEHIAAKMAEAKKKQEEYNEAVRKGKEITLEAGASHEKTMDGLRARMAKLQGDSKGEAFFKGRQDDAESIDRLAKYVDKVTEALRKQQTAAAALMPMWAALGRAWNAVSTTVSGSAPIEKIYAATQEFREKAAELAMKDEQNHTRSAAKFIQEEHDKAQAALDAAIAAAPEPGIKHPLPAGAPSTRYAGGVVPAAREGADVTAARKQQLDTMNEIAAEAKRESEEAAAKSKADAMEAGAAHARELRSEIEAVQRLAASSQALASSEELAAAATGKGSAASIQAAAAAEAQKKIQDFLAESDTKFFSNTQQKIAATKQFQDALTAALPAIRSAALAEQTFKAFAEYSRSIAEFNTHLKERVSVLDEEAAGHSKVAAEQAKELAGLIPLEQKLASLKALETHAAPAIGPPTANQAGIANAGAGLDSARQAAGLVNAKIQTGAFREELDKLSDEMKLLAGSEVSPWAKIDAQVLKLTDDLKLDESQVLAIRDALLGLQEIKIAAEFEKLGTKLREVGASNAAIAAGSPFAKIDADVVKFTRELGLNAQQIATLRQGLIALQSADNIGKTWLNVDALNASGAKMTELRQQMEALRAAARSGRVQTDDGGSVALSRDALAAVHQEMLAIADEQNKIALKTGDIDAGILAWATDLQKVQSAGEVTLEALTQATKGFEENAAKSFMMVLESQRGGQRALIHDLEKLWSDYFKNLATMGMKQGMEHLLAPLGKAITGGMGKGASAGGTASLSAAGTLLTHAGTELLSAAMALRASAGVSAGGGGGSPFGNIAEIGGAIPFFAAGGDTTPGSSFISGEAGAERVDLNGRGGAHITPLEAAAPSGETNHFYDMRNSVVTEDLMRRSEAASAIHASESRMMSALPAMQREISLRKRS
jgi:hypothetical protein